MRKHHTIRVFGQVAACPSRRPVAEVLAGATLTGALITSILHPGTAGARMGPLSHLTVAAPATGPISLASATVASGRIWVAGGNGQVSSPNGSPAYGQLAGAPASPIVAAAATPDGSGYWLTGSDGGVFSFGDAGFYGSMGGVHLNAPIVGMAPTPSGRGYWLVASDGGIFSFGDAGFHGSTGDIHLDAPIVGMAPTPAGAGYWLLGSDGGIFSFGDAAFHGSLGANPPAAPLRAMVADPAGGYWLVGSTGSVYPFGPTGARPSVAVAADPSTVALAAAAASPARPAGAAAAVAFADAQVGKPYVWGGTGPGGYDCSGLTQVSWGAGGVALARVAAAQYNDGVHVPLGAAAPGDLVFWSSNGAPSGIYHVGMALGNGLMVDAPKPGTTVRVEAIWGGALPLATRP